MISSPAGNPERLDAPRSFAEAAGVTSLADLPIVVMTAADHPRPDLELDAAAELARVWSEGQLHWASLSTQAQLVSVEHTGHMIQLEQPATVIEHLLGLLA